MRKTVVMGATPHPYRYAFLAANKLKGSGEEFVLVGIRKGEVAGQEILDLRTKPEIQDVDTVTLYISPGNLIEWEDYILSLEPKRIIFNPGTENPPFAARAQASGIEIVQACTLVMLSARTY